MAKILFIHNPEACNNCVLDDFVLLSHTNKHIVLVTLVQTLPDSNLPVCSSQTLIYTCNSTTGYLRWKDGEKAIVYFPAITPSLTFNESELLVNFTVQLISINGSNLSSTAVFENVSSADEGTTIACQDGIFSLEESVTVAGMFMLSFLHNEAISSLMCWIQGAVLLLQHYFFFQSCVTACLCYMQAKGRRRKGKGWREKWENEKVESERE